MKRTLIVVEESCEPQWGPAMNALPNDKWRSFVLALFSVKPGYGALRAAAKMAGFGKEGTTDEAISVMASRIAHDPRTIVAIREEGTKRLIGSSPAAISALLDLVANANHKDHARAIAMLLDRVHPSQTEHTVVVNNVSMTDDAMIARITELALAQGLDPRKLLGASAPIDVEFAEVTPNKTELKDWSAL